MGCSASRRNTFLTKNHHHRSLENNPSCSCHSLKSTTFSSSYSSKPVSRALSFQLPLPTPLVHYPPSRKGDSHHLVSLTSTTYGYGSLLRTDIPKVSPLNGQDCSHHHNHHQAQSPSHNINTTTKPGMPTTTTNPVESLSRDSVIDTWELMEGLDYFDIQGLGRVEVSSKIQKNSDNSCGSANSSTFIQADSPSLKKLSWKHLSEESLQSIMEPNVASSCERTVSFRQLGFHLRKESSISSCLGSSPVTNIDSYSHPSCTNNQIILIYFTSLRGIRKTYEHCCLVRMIFKSYRVAVDERDISMDSNYRKELQRLLIAAGAGNGEKSFSLPQVFITGQHIGGAEDIKQLNEAGELAKLLQGFPLLKNNPASFCESCGDARFLPCSNCCGSRKVFDEEENQLRRCSHCNENGLIRCPSCCYNLV